MAENDIPLTWVLTTIIVIILAAVGYVVQAKYRKDTKRDADVEKAQTASTLSQANATIALEKAQAVVEKASALAKEVRRETEETAKAVRLDTEKLIETAIAGTEKDTKYHFEAAAATVEGAKSSVRHMGDDIKEKLDSLERHTNEKIKAIEGEVKLIQQIMFGTEAHSMPPYMKGEEETAEEKAKPGEGIFKTKKENNKNKKED